jgi:hypothetical protein
MAMATGTSMALLPMGSFLHPQSPPSPLLMGAGLQWQPVRLGGGTTQPAGLHASTVSVSTPSGQC